MNCLRLSTNGYLVSIPIKYGRKVILNIDYPKKNELLKEMQ